MDNAFVPYRWGYDYGVGVNSASGDRMQQGVEGTPAPVANASGGSGTFQIASIASTSELEDHLGISADASGGVGLFSASDRFSFAKDCKIQTSSISLLFWCTQQNGFTQIDRPQLDADAAALVAQGNAILFNQRYGDCFVAGLETGGQFWGVMRIDVKTQSDQQTIQNSLSGSYGPFSADVQVKLDTALTQTQSTAHVFVYYEGGSITTKPITPKDLFDAANEWSASVKAAPKPYTALLMPWVVANGPNPPNAADLDHQRDVLKTCAKLRSQVQDRLNLLEYMTDPEHSGEFIMAPTDPDRLSKLHATVGADYDLILEAASFAIDNAKDAVEPETYAQTKKGMAGYALTMLPADLPKRIASLPPTIKTPDFSQTPLLLARQVAKTSGINLTADFIQKAITIYEAGQYQLCRIQHQDPAPGTLITAGSTVHVTALGPPM